MAVSFSNLNFSNKREHLKKLGFIFYFGMVVNVIGVASCKLEESKTPCFFSKNPLIFFKSLNFYKKNSKKCPPKKMFFFLPQFKGASLFQIFYTKKAIP
jgi:hypothetical protein